MNNTIAVNFFKTLDQNLIKYVPEHEIQYDFWLTPKESEIEMMQKKVADLNVSFHRVRRCIFAENGALKKRVTEMEDRLAILERHICHS